MRAVLDTNVVVSALLFVEGRLSWLRHAWQKGVIRPVVCKETVTEILRVLAYPKFRLTPEDRDQLLADFLPFTEAFPLERFPKGVPQCRDPYDQVFLFLAKAAKADALVTGDADLLALKGKFSPPILTAEELRHVLTEGKPK